MKTKLLRLTVVLVAFLSQSLYAQEYAFKVLVSKGKNEVKSGANWEPLRVGGSLKSLDEVKLAENSYLGLIHVSGKPLEVKEAKKYRVSELEQKVGKGATVLNKYTEFILSSNTQPRNSLTATGAVHRGVHDIRIFLPKADQSYVLGDTISIEWEQGKGAPPFTVTFTSFFGDELYKTETNNYAVTVNLNDPNFSRENEFQVQVFSNTDRKQSEVYAIRRVSKTERSRLKPLFAEVKAQTSEKSAINKMYQAGFLEDNKMLIDAATAFQQAVKLEPALKENYEEFLLRNGMKDLPPPRK